MSRPRAAGRSRGPDPDQLPLPAPATPPAKRRAVQTPAQIAKGAIAKRGKPSAVPGNVMLTMTFDLKRSLAERLSERAVRTGVSMEAVILDLVKDELGP